MQMLVQMHNRAAIKLFFYLLLLWLKNTKRQTLVGTMGVSGFPGPADSRAFTHWSCLQDPLIDSLVDVGREEGNGMEGHD